MTTGPKIGALGLPEVVTSEAEFATLQGDAVISTDWAGYDGAGFVDFRQSDGDSITWTVEVAQTGTYAMGLRYALQDSDRNATGRPLEVFVNGVAQSVLPFLPTGDSFQDWAIAWDQIILPAGLVTLTLATTGESGANLDQLLFRSAPVVLGNSAPTISGVLPALEVAAGRAGTIDLAALTLTDADVADPLTALVTLADGTALPSFLRFDPSMMTLRATADAPAGSYALKIWADDGQTRSASSVALTVQVRPPALVLPDLDADGIGNRRDIDDDNDGLSDRIDPFLADASNGRGVRIDAGGVYVLGFAGAPAGGPVGWGQGLTGVMVNGVATPEQLGLGGAGFSFANGALHIENAGTGRPGPDGLRYGASFGIDPNAPKLTISVRLDNPFDTQAAALGQSFGLFLGTGTQDDYVRLVLQAGASGGVFLRLEGEQNGSALAGARDYVAGQFALAAADAGDTIRLSFEIDTVTGVLRPSWTVETATGVVTGTGEAIVLGGSLLAAVRGDTVTNGTPTGLAVGVNATSGGAVPLDLDVLEFRVEGGGAPNVRLTGLDAPMLTDRLVFNWIDDPDQNSIPDREYKDTGTVRVTNTGPGVLDISRLALSGPFVFLEAGDADARLLAAGESLLVEVGFDRSQFTPPPRGTGGQFAGTLEVFSNDPDQPVVDIALGGWWQTVPEAGREPTLNDIFEVFGFGNRVDNAILHDGQYVKAAAEEVLAPYWQIKPGYAEARIVQLAGFKDAGIATMALHKPFDQTDTRMLLQQDDLYNQSFLPLLSDDSALEKSFGGNRVPDEWQGDDWFGFRSAGNSSDPGQNRPPAGNGDIRGHFVRFFAATEADGTVIADTYLIAVDFNGSNLDFNDTLYLVSGITPVVDLLLV